MTTVSHATDAVKKSILVKAPVARAFEVYTAGFDTWWPRSHHIGKLPMRTAIFETRAGGRCYSVQADGSECEWGRVLVWEPPTRFVLAWQITPEWGFEPDLAKASEVEVRFTPEGEGSTRVDLEHRHFERHGAGGQAIRTAVDAPNGWSGLLQMFADRAAREAMATGRNSSAAGLALIFAVNEGLFTAALDGVSEVDLWRPLAEGANPMLWIAGHAVQARASLLGRLGQTVDTGWADLFGRGVTLRDRAAYPATAAIRETWGRVSSAIQATLTSVGETELQGPMAGRPTPMGKTLGDQVAFLALHDSYHVGQLAYVRKALGYSAIAG